MGGRQGGQLHAAGFWDDGRSHHGHGREHQRHDLSLWLHRRHQRAVHLDQPPLPVRRDPPKLQQPSHPRPSVRSFEGCWVRTGLSCTAVRYLLPSTELLNGRREWDTGAAACSPPGRRGRRRH